MYNRFFSVSFGIICLHRFRHKFYSFYILNLLLHFHRCFISSFFRFNLQPDSFNTSRHPFEVTVVTLLQTREFPYMEELGLRDFLVDLTKCSTGKHGKLLQLHPFFSFSLENYKEIEANLANLWEE